MAESGLSRRKGNDGHASTIISFPISFTANIISYSFEDIRRGVPSKSKSVLDLSLAMDAREDA